MQCWYLFLQLLKVKLPHHPSTPLPHNTTLDTLHLPTLLSHNTHNTAHTPSFHTPVTQHSITYTSSSHTSDNYMHFILPHLSCNYMHTVPPHFCQTSRHNALAIHTCPTTMHTSSHTSVTATRTPSFHTLTRMPSYDTLPPLAGTNGPHYVLAAMDAKIQGILTNSQISI